MKCQRIFLIFALIIFILYGVQFYCFFANRLSYKNSAILSQTHRFLGTATYALEFTVQPRSLNSNTRPVVRMKIMEGPVQLMEGPVELIERPTGIAA